MDERQQIETMLIENMQRADLTVYEQARSFQLMLDLGSDTKTIAKNTGFSVATVKHRLKLAELDPEKLKAASERQITLTDYIELEKIKSLDRRNRVLEFIGTENYKLEYNRAVTEELIEKNLPLVKSALEEAGAKKITKEQSWSNKYTRYPRSLFYIYLTKWGKDGNVLPKLLPDKKMYYVLDSNSLMLFTDAEEEERPKETPEEKEKKAEARKAWAEIKRLGEETYKLRSDFIASYKVKEIDLPLLLAGCLMSGLIYICSYAYIDSNAILRELGIEKPVYPYTEQIYEKIQESDLDQALRLVYLMFGDSAQLLTAAGPKGDLPYYYPSKRTEILYDFLKSLGYKISDEEKALLDGSHEAYGGRKNL